MVEKSGNPRGEARHPAELGVDGFSRVEKVSVWRDGSMWGTVAFGACVDTETVGG